MIECKALDSHLLALKVIVDATVRRMSAFRPGGYVLPALVQANESCSANAVYSSIQDVPAIKMVLGVEWTTNRKPYSQEI